MNIEYDLGILSNCNNLFFKKMLYVTLKNVSNSDHGTLEWFYMNKSISHLQYQNSENQQHPIIEKLISWFQEIYGLGLKVEKNHAN